MTKICTTGVFLVAECDLQLERCLARSPAPVTVVLAQPSGMQTNVCSVCLQTMLDRQEWYLAGAGFRAQYDFVLTSGTNEPLIVLEVKRKPAGEVDEPRWANAYARNLTAHGRLRMGGVLILSVLDGTTYGWRVTGRLGEPLLVSSVATDRAFADLGLEAPMRGLDEGFAESYYTEFIERLITPGLSRSLPWIDELHLADLPLAGSTVRSQVTLAV